MTYSVRIRHDSVIDNGVLIRGERKSWWGNFTKAIREAEYGPGLNFSQSDWIMHRYNELSKFNAFYDGAHVHFDTERDAVMFMLRYA